MRIPLRLNAWWSRSTTQTANSGSGAAPSCASSTPNSLVRQHFRPVRRCAAQPAAVGPTNHPGDTFGRWRGKQRRVFGGGQTPPSARGEQDGKSEVQATQPHDRQQGRVFVVRLVVRVRKAIIKLAPARRRSAASRRS